MINNTLCALCFPFRECQPRVAIALAVAQATLRRRCVLCALPALSALSADRQATGRRQTGLNKF